MLTWLNILAELKEMSQIHPGTKGVDNCGIFVVPVKKEVLFELK